MKVIAELNELINLLEAEIPANPNSAKNLKLRRRLERELARYFKSLEDAFPYGKLAGIYNRYGIKESLGSETEDMLNPLLATFDSILTDKLISHLATIYKAGSDEMVAWGNKTRESTYIVKEVEPGDFEGPPMQEAIDWAKKYIAKIKLVDGLNEETVKQISNVISDGIKNKRGIPGIKSDIRHKFDWMARGAPSDIKGLTLASRAEMIARTETSNALSQASLGRMKDMGIEGKEWVTSGDDRVSKTICAPNEAQGVIAVDEAFQSGHDAPPGHPRCRCALAPAILSK